jgi:hypothetical protein
VTKDVKAWASRVLIRIHGQHAAQWYVLEDILLADEADEEAAFIRYNGVTALVCTEEEFDLLGLPTTPNGDEYFVK